MTFFVQSDPLPRVPFWTSPVEVIRLSVFPHITGLAEFTMNCQAAWVLQTGSRATCESDLLLG